MELFGILFAMPIGFVVSLLYVRKAADWLDYNKLSAAVWVIPTITVLMLACIEITILISVGAYKADQQHHVAFSLLHLPVLFLGAPAVANAVLLISRRLHISRKASITAATLLCFLAGMTLLFTNIVISEDIYGVDGTGVRPGVD